MPNGQLVCPFIDLYIMLFEKLIADAKFLMWVEMQGVFCITTFTQKSNQPVFFEQADTG